MMHVPEHYRIRTGYMGSGPEVGNNGAFRIPALGRIRPLPLTVIASNGDGWADCGYEPPVWEHVSISTPVRCPTWEEMCFVKGLFWDDEDTVMQLHPPKSQWINNHPYCLHLWRPIGIAIPMPPSLAVGIRDAG